MKRAALAIGAVVALLANGSCGRVETRIGEERLDPAIPPPASLYFEAESGLLDGGFTIASDRAASGGSFILPPAGARSQDAPGAASASYTFVVPAAGRYRVWGRLRGSGPEHNSFWVSVDGEPAYVWRLSTGVVWFWSFFTRDFEYGQAVEYTLAGGEHRLVVRNRDPDVGLDRLFVGTLDDVPSGNDTPCNPPHSIQVADGGCVPSCGSHGSTTCGNEACAAQPKLVAYDCEVCCYASDGGADADAEARVEAGADASDAASDAGHVGDASAD